MKCKRKMWMEGGERLRNVSSMTRVDNSQSSCWIAAFPHPWLPGTEGQGEFGIRRCMLRAGPRAGNWVLGRFPSPLLLTCWNPWPPTPIPKSWNCNLLVLVDTSAPPRSAITQCGSQEIEKWLFGKEEVIGEKWLEERDSGEPGAYVLIGSDPNWCSTFLRGASQIAVMKYNSDLWSFSYWTWYAMLTLHVTV